MAERKVIQFVGTDGNEYDVRDEAAQQKIGTTALPTTAQTLTGAIAEHESDITNQAAEVNSLKSALINGEGFIETHQKGYLYQSGIYDQVNSYCSISRTYKVKQGDRFIYKGIGDSNPCVYLFKNNGSVTTVKHGTFTVIPLVVDIPANVDEVVFSSYASGSDYNNVIFEVIKLTGSTPETEILWLKENTDSNDYFAELRKTSYLKPTGVFDTGNQYYSITRIYLVDGVKKFIYNGLGNGAACCCIKVKNGAIVSYVQGDYRSTPLEVTVDNTFDSIIFSSYGVTTDYDEVVFSVSKDATDDNTYQKIQNNKQQIDGINGKIAGKYVETRQRGYMDGYGNYAGTSDYCSITRRYENVSENDTFIYRGLGNAAARIAVLLKADGTLHSTLQGDYLTINKEVVIPSNVKTIVFSSYATGADYNDVFLHTEYVGNEGLQSQIDLIHYEFANVLYGKKWVACGDSFTQGDFAGYVDSEGHTLENSDAYDKQWRMYKTYPWWIARRNGMQLVNEALRGTTMALTRRHIEDPDTYPESDKSPFSYQRYQAVPADADYITLWFDINDQAYCNLGTINDTTNETTYGAWNVVMEWLITNRPWAKIGIVVTNAIQTTHLDFASVPMDIAKRWGVGYLDLQQDYTVPLTLDVNTRTELCDTAKNLRNAQYYVGNDNHHPSLKAHEYQSTFIENWLRSL